MAFEYESKQIEELIAEENLSIEKGEGHCAKCGNREITYGDEKSFGDSGIRYYHCEKCKHYGEEHYIEVWAGSK